jgi:cytochrome b involved in lipid metabolism
MPTPTIARSAPRVLAPIAVALLLLLGSPLAPASATAATSGATASTAPAVFATKSYSKRTVAKHHTASDCWSIVDGKVYNLTKWIAKHPGGRKRIIGMCGVDASRAFHNQHSGGGRAGAALKRYYLGRVK